VPAISIIVVEGGGRVVSLRLQPSGTDADRKA